MQIWQDRSIHHTCSSSHDRLKSTPSFDLNSLLYGTSGGNDEFEFEEFEYVPSRTIVAIENPVPISALELDPTLFTEIVIKIEPYQSRCGPEPVKPRYSRSSWQAVQQMRQFRTITRNYGSCLRSDA